MLKKPLPEDLYYMGRRARCEARDRATKRKTRKQNIKKGSKSFLVSCNNGTKLNTILVKLFERGCQEFREVMGSGMALKVFRLCEHGLNVRHRRLSDLPRCYLLCLRHHSRTRKSCGKQESGLPPEGAASPSSIILQHPHVSYATPPSYPPRPSTYCKCSCSTTPALRIARRSQIIRLFR